MYKSIKKSAILLLMMLFGCSSKQQANNIRISLTDSNKNLKIIGIGVDILQEIDGDSITSVWQSLAPVYRMPADTDLKDFQKPQPGKYVVKADAVIFTPDTPFNKQSTYFVRYYRYNIGNSALDHIETNKKLGKTSYTDLIFKQ
jgi:hypothetical protein